MSDLAIYALAGFAATEATGVTNVTGGGSGRGSGGPSLGDIANVVEANQADTPDMGSLAQAVAQATESGTTVVRAGGEGSSSGGIQAAIQALREQRQQVEDTTNTVKETTDLLAEIRQWREENIPTPDRDRDQNQDGSNGSSGGSGGGGGSGGNGSRTQGSDGYDIQTDYDGMFSEEVRGGAEILNQSGGVIDAVTSAPGDAAGFAGASGRTIGEAWDLVTKGRADTSGTLAKDRGEVMLDFSGDGNPGGKLSDRIPFFGGDDQDSSSDDGSSSSSSSSSSGASSSSSSSDRDQREATNPVEQYKEDVRTVNDDPDDAPGREREKEKPDFSSNPVRNSWNTPGFTR